ncbi:MAG: GTPase domain-containing protein [Planctomycetes bacterium]|nr:GTPase domain-containing protein [Planctomycetota bacterium]
MTDDFSSWAGQIKRLHAALGELEPEAASIGVEKPEGREWFDLLRNKLLGELDFEPLLVVAVVGGTNIGKSVIFNHLAGEVASAASALAAGTKHPVCLAPEGLDDPAVLRRRFKQFQLCPWQSADDALEDSPEHRVFWRQGPNVPPKLLLLDAPDVDSDVTVNWHRSRAIRQAADVLVAVLTQQKYNDAAVKQFFREAAAADKPFVVVFNQCDLVADREYWPKWLATFCRETGARPELVYVAPYDREAAGALQLPFYSVGLDGLQPPGEPSSLRDDLASLHFDAIKIRTFRGALGRVLDEQSGLGAHLDTIRTTAAEYAAAEEVLSATEMARVAWPTLPASILVDEIRQWWDTDRRPWSRRVHGFYRTLGRGVTWPVRSAWTAMAGSTTDPLAAFQARQRGAVVTAVEKMLDELERLAKVGNDTLQPRLMQLLGGDVRARLLQRVQSAHGELPIVDDDYRSFVRGELDQWKRESPRAVGFLRSLDHAAALARPAITVTLAVTGFAVAGDLVGQAAAHAAGHTASELAIAGGITGGGEVLVSSTSEGIRQAAARLFSRLQSRYAQQRAQWLAGWLENELLGSLLDDLRRGAEVPSGDAFGEVESLAAALVRQSED